MLARFDQSAPAARVPLPIHVDVPKVPCWSCPQSEKWPMSFQTDLDLLAPLGDGPANAALWLKDFAKPQGARLAEAEAAMKRRIEGPGDFGLVLPPGDPLLREAEPWADQATMRFYPDVWAAEGASTPIPNLLVGLSFAKSWAARAAANPDAPSAIEDCRRRDPMGTAPPAGGRDAHPGPRRPRVHPIGAEQLYALAARRGDQALMLAAAIVQGEAAPQRLRTAQITTRLAVSVEARTSRSRTGRSRTWPASRRLRPTAASGTRPSCMLGFARFIGHVRPARIGREGPHRA